MDACICLAESPHCPPETITTLLISCTPIQNVFVVLKKPKPILVAFPFKTVLNCVFIFTSSLCFKNNVLLRFFFLSFFFFWWIHYKLTA